MFNIRFYGCRITAMKRYFTFERPPPGYMFKRPVVPSDLEYPEFFNEIKNNEFDCEKELWCNDKYISDDNIKNEIYERYNSRED